MPGFSQSKFSAYLQSLVSKRREEVGLYKEIADKLPLMATARLLDVGTGSGSQLKVIRRIQPNMALYGLDLSEASIEVARKNLMGMNIELGVGTIEQTSYKDDFFDIVTCNSSMSYWKNPLSCFNEIYRILKPGGEAYLFEPQKDINFDEVVEIIKQNLADKSWFRRTAAANFNKFGIRWGRKVGLKLYTITELEGLAQQSDFRESYRIERTELQNLPIFIEIKLVKPHQH